MNPKNFVGTWRLVSMKARSSVGSVTYPLGRSPHGFIMYSADGYMCVAMARSGRAPFGTPDIMRGNETELAAAARSYISYAGPYEICDGRVRHHVETSLFPDWVGTTQERIYEFAESRLTLSTDPIPVGGYEVRVSIVWERVR